MVTEETIIVPEPSIFRRITAIIEEVVGDKPPEIPLYHYTTLECMLKIFESRKMWASDLGFLKDPAEIQHGLDLICECVKQRRDRTTDECEKVVCQEILSSAYWRIGSHKGPYSRCFSFSLTENGDLLSQWRGYAPNEDGVAICFSPDKLIKLADCGHPLARFKFMKCRYKTEEKMKIIDAFVKKIVAEVRPKYDALMFSNSWVEWTVPGVFALSAMFKREQFSSEAEWRAIAIAQTTEMDYVKYRTRDCNKLPYIEFDLTSDGIPLPIDRVIICPGPNQDQRWLAVNDLVHKIIGGQVKVIKSTITLR